MANRNQRIKIISTLIVVVGITVFVMLYKGVSFSEILNAASHFDKESLGIALLFSGLQILGMILRIGVLFPLHSRVSWLRVSEGVIFGQCANAFLPARAGDALKAVVFSRPESNVKSPSEGLPILTSAGILLSDKVMDTAGFILLILLSGSLRWVVMKMPSAPSLNVLAAVGLVGLLLIVAAAFLFKAHLTKIRGWWTRFKDGFEALARPRALGFALILAALSWSFEAISLKTLCASQGYPMTLAQVVFLLTVLNLAIAVPVSAGNVGTYEASLVYAAGTFGVPMAASIAVASMQHFLQIVAVGIWSLLLALYLRLQKRSFEKAANKTT